MGWKTSESIHIFSNTAYTAAGGEIQSENMVSAGEEELRMMVWLPGTVFGLETTGRSTRTGTEKPTKRMTKPPSSGGCYQSKVMMSS